MRHKKMHHISPIPILTIPDLDPTSKIFPFPLHYYDKEKAFWKPASKVYRLLLIGKSRYCALSIADAGGLHLPLDDTDRLVYNVNYMVYFIPINYNK